MAGMSAGSIDRQHREFARVRETGPGLIRFSIRRAARISSASNRPRRRCRRAAVGLANREIILGLQIAAAKAASGSADASAGSRSLALMSVSGRRRGLENWSR